MFFRIDEPRDGSELGVRLVKHEWHQCAAQVGVEVREQRFFLGEQLLDAVPLLRSIWPSLQLFMQYLERLVEPGGLLLSGARGDWVCTLRHHARTAHDNRVALALEDS